jgi:HEAT repeat protein
VAPSSIDRVAARLEDADPALAEQAALALGESRHPEALAALRRSYEDAVEGARRRVLLIAIVMLRSDEAHAFALDQVAQARQATAMQAIDALAIYQHDPRVRDRVLEIVRKRGDAKLVAHAKEKLRG